MPNTLLDTVLIVDDAPENILVLDGILRDRYRVRVATDGAKALAICKGENPPSIILLDVMMPDLSGFEVCRRLKSHPQTSSIPVIFVTAMGEISNEAMGLSLGAVDYIHKPITPAIVLARIQTHLALRNHNRHLEAQIRMRTAELEDTRQEIIRQLGRAAEFKDNQTGLHVVRMSHYCRILGDAVGMRSNETELLFSAAPMHDIGKIGIPDSILTKPGKLDEAEWVLMRRHPELGVAILGDHPSPLLVLARQIALTHHERWNGQGYPHGLRGEEIPLVGRIAALADVFDALTSERPYKRAWPMAEAVDYIRQEAGSHFDPQLVELFLKQLPRIQECHDRYAEVGLDPVFQLDRQPMPSWPAAVAAESVSRATSLT